jgi:hypothetical protein
MEVGSFTIIATPYSLFPPVFARGIFELAVNKGVISIRGFVEEVKDAAIQKGFFRNSFSVYPINLSILCHFVTYRDSFAAAGVDGGFEIG